MGLGGDPALQGQFHRAQHGLLVVLQHQGEDVHHLPVAPWTSQQFGLEPAERLRHLGKRRAVAQRPWLALDHRQVVPPVVDRAAGSVVGALSDPGVLADDMALGHHHEPVGVDPQADRSIAGRGYCCVERAAQPPTGWSPAIR